MFPNAVQAGVRLALCTLFACGGAAVDTTSEATGPGSEASSSSDASETSTSSEEGGQLEPGPDVDIWAFQDAHSYFLGEDNQREIDAVVEFPADDLGYETILFNFALSCPNSDCDDWDRRGYIGVVNNPGSEDESVTEIFRFITPYNVGGQWQQDVSELRPLLTGTQTLRLFIDTWVGPGHANGNGWLVNAQLEFKGGVASPRPIAVLDIWPESGLESGDPNNPIDGQIVETMVELPEGTTSVWLRSLITGHGQGNADNCAEFCALQHGYIINNESYGRLVWRDDCAENPVNNQGGNWQPDRAGWCPGADVLPWVEDVSAAIDGASVTVAYALEDYENTCRPDAPICEGCVFGTSCDYDGGQHTPPQYRMSAALIAYGE